MSGGVTGALIAGGIAAAGTLGSSYLQAKAQDKAADEQAKAARRNQELAERQASQEEQARNRQNAAGQQVNAAAIADQIERSAFGQNTGGTGISRDKLNLGTAATLGQQNQLNSRSTMGTQSSLGGNNDNPLLL